MLQLDLSDHRAIYEQIHDKLRELIVSGALHEGDKIPSVRDLASSLAINPNTIQKAYKDLENEGYIYSVRAKGSFVAALPKAECSARVLTLYKNLTQCIRELKFLGETREGITGRIDKVFCEGGSAQ